MGVMTVRRVYENRISLVGSGATTFDPAHVGPNLLLSNGNRTIGASNDTDNLARTIASASTGQKYHELTLTTVTSVTTMTHGFGNATASLTVFAGANNDCVGWAGDGKVYRSSAVALTVASWVQGDTLCFAQDLTAGKIWFRVNGGNWNNDILANQNPATGTGGYDYVSAGLNAGPYFPLAMVHDHTEVITANFGGSAYAQTPPAGFGNW